MKFYRYIVLTALAITSQLFMLSHASAQADNQNRVLEWPDGTRYEGEVQNGQMHGQGTIYWTDGTRFEGSFTNNMRDGPGRMILPDGTEFTGVFEENQLITRESEPLAPVAETEPEPMEPMNGPLPGAGNLEVGAGDPDMPVPGNQAAQTRSEQAPEEQMQSAEAPVESETAIAEVPDLADAERPEESSRANTQATEQPEATAARTTLISDEAGPEIPESVTRRQPEEIAAEEPDNQTDEAAPAPANINNQEPREATAEDELEYTDALENEVVAVIDAWASAWSAQNPALYLSFYSEDFEVPNGLSRSAWENQRRNRLNAPEFIQVDVGYAQFELVDNSTIEVSLRQGYTSDTYSDFTNKMIRLQREDGLWKIVREETI